LMSFKNLDVESALARIADRKIEEAMREGKFDNLPGAGKPLDLEPIPTDERARMLWWAIKLLKQNDVVPEEITWRKQIDELRQKLAAAANEDQIAVLVVRINRLVRQLNTLGTNAIASSVQGVSLEAEVKRFRLAGPATAHATPARERTTLAQQPTRNEATKWFASTRGGVRHCANAGCKSRNPLTARFCRRCGAVMHSESA
jgi:hypothetical protein